ncbi:methylmalonyl Co-A mutase-associated GTPase MeaB [Raineya sp.]|jgi:LAO/AO transport system kinase
MRKRYSAETYINGILAGNRIILAQAITLIESQRNEDEKLAKEVLGAVLPYTGKSIRIGITGVPGVGKSTFIESFGLEIVKNTENKLAVLAIDPSSQKSGGSILGDKTRMENLAMHPQVFIRPSPAGSSLGGVARKTREVMLLCEAAGFETIFIETVGVGQSETAVKSMTDFFLLLMLAGAGDELQGIKRGIMEMADMLVITKADGENKHKALVAQKEYQSALHLLSPAQEVPVLTCSALQNEGLSEIWQTIQKFLQEAKQNNVFEQKRQQQQLQWFHEHLREGILNLFYQNLAFKEKLQELEKNILANQKEPFQASREILEGLRLENLRFEA